VSTPLARKPSQISFTPTLLRKCMMHSPCFNAIRSTVLPAILFVVQAATPIAAHAQSGAQGASSGDWTAVEQAPRTERSCAIWRCDEVWLRTERSHCRG
jgi:hypothetical protein